MSQISFCLSCLIVLFVAINYIVFPEPVGESEFLYQESEQEQANKRIVQKFIHEVINKAKVELIDELFVDSYRVEKVSVTLSQLKTAVLNLFDNNKSHQLQRVEVSARGDKVIVRFPGFVTESGLPVEKIYCDRPQPYALILFKVINGKIVRSTYTNWYTSGNPKGIEIIALKSN